MRAWMRYAARVFVVTVALSLCPPSDRSATSDSSNQTTVHFEQVRLRKLHLVRPDLIPYPISFEVYC